MRRWGDMVVRAREGGGRGKGAMKQTCDIPKHKMKLKNKFFSKREVKEIKSMLITCCMAFYPGAPHGII